MDTKTAIEPSEGRMRIRLREAAGASWLPWLTGRAMVLAALALARYEVSHLHIAPVLSDGHLEILGVVTVDDVLELLLPTGWRRDFGRTAVEE